MTNAEKGIIYYKWGDPHELAYLNLPEKRAINPDRIKLKRNQLLIKVRAISVNPVDWKILSGSQIIIAGSSFPRVFGADFSGEIYKNGSIKDNCEMNMGDRVMGMVSPLNNGSGRQWLIVNAAHCIKIPASMSFEEAASLTAAGISAIKATDFTKSRRPGSALVVGAGGGVGILALQILSSWGWHVTVVARKNQYDFLRKLGCGAIIDKSDWKIMSEQKGNPSQKWDLIVDGPGTIITGRPVKYLNKKGHYISVYIPDSFIAAQVLRTLFWKFRSYSTGFFLAFPSRSRMKRLEDYINRDVLRPVIDSIWNSSDCNKAVMKSFAGGITGKIIIKMM